MPETPPQPSTGNEDGHDDDIGDLVVDMII
jgi:hypothetical protein